MSRFFYIQSRLNQLVLTIDGFSFGGKLLMYPAYGGANQLWSWGPNNTLVSKMGLVADVFQANNDPGTNCIGYCPNGGENQNWQYKNGQIISTMNGLVMEIKDGNTNVATEVQMMHSNIGELKQHWVLVAKR